MRFLFKNKKHHSLIGLISYILICSSLLAVCSKPTYAYINPGLGVTFFAAIGTFIVAVVIAIFGILLLPYKLLMRKIKKHKKAPANKQEDQEAITKDESNINGDQ